MTSKVRIAPSILSADLGKLAAEIADVEAAGADYIHVDVMDGRFVPNITLGPIIVGAARRATKLPLDVHLMIVEPEKYIDAFAEAGADIIGVHVEASVHLQRTLTRIRALKKLSCVVMNPHTHESSIEYVMEDVDQILVMSVNPGFGGQSFIESSLRKIAALRKRVDALGLRIDIEVDGGVGPDTAKRVVDAGANVLVAGNAVFGKPDRKAAIDAIRRSLGEA